MALANRSIGYDEVEARDLRFNLDKDSVPRYWMNNDPWSTSFFNSILAAVPDGERWVMQCVRQSLTRLQDESVRKAGIAFIKQEHYHAREHDDMNNALIAQGVPLDVVERSFKRIRGTLERLTPPDMHLSMMAAFEHFTATFAAVFIDNPDMLDNSDKKVAAMLYWHFVEETEHKSVTFDVFQDAVGSYPQRVAGMLIASAIFLPMVEGHMLYLLYKEKQLLNWRSMLNCLKLQVGPRACSPACSLGITSRTTCPASTPGTTTTAARSASGRKPSMPPAIPPRPTKHSFTVPEPRARASTPRSPPEPRPVRFDAQSGPGALPHLR